MHHKSETILLTGATGLLEKSIIQKLMRNVEYIKHGFAPMNAEKGIVLIFSVSACGNVSYASSETEPLLAVFSFGPKDWGCVA